MSERIAEAPSGERGDFPAVRPAPSTSRLRKWLMARLQWFSVLGLIIILEVIGRLGFSRVIPPFSDVVRNLVDLARTGKLDTITLSFQALGIGFGLALICGLGLAIATTTWKTLDYVVEPYINAFMSMPTSALIPVLMIIFGLGQTTRIVVVFIYAFFVIVVNTQAGLRQIAPNLAEMARAFGARGPRYLRMVTVPAALPLMLAGIRLGISRALKGMVNSETIISVTGIGALIIRYGRTFDVVGVYSILLLVIVLAVMATGLIQMVENRTLRWEQ